MAPIKFEEHIKEKLDERKITPSTGSWDAIADRLNTLEQPKKKGYFWYGIAAGFIGVLFVSVLYFNKEEIKEPKASEMVTTPVSKKKAKEISGKKKLPVLPEIQEEEGIVQTQKKENVVPKQVLKSNADAILSEQSNQLVQEEVLVDRRAVEERVENKTVKTLTEAAIDAKIAEVIAQVDAIEGTSEEMTDLEVDSLLRKAQRELLTNKLFRADNTVDAQALLAEAEGELDRSLRDQLFDALKSGYLKVRTAVADRNN